MIKEKPFINTSLVDKIITAFNCDTPIKELTMRLEVEEDKAALQKHFAEITKLITIGSIQTK